MSSEESNKMSKKTPSQDLNFKKIWWEMERIEPLTPLPIIPDNFEDYIEAKKCDDFIFGDYESFEEKDEGDTTTSYISTKSTVTEAQSEKEWQDFWCKDESFEDK